MVKIKKMLRRQKTRISLYLDYTVNGKRVQEYTKLFYLPGKDNITKAHNKNVDVRFEKKLADKINQLFTGSNEYIPAERRKTSVFEYINKYQSENPTTDRKLLSCTKHLSTFTQGKLIFDNVNESFLKDFQNYLQARLSGETPKGYLKALGRVFLKAKREQYLSNNTPLGIKISFKPAKIKETLTLKEIVILKNSSCSNLSVKRAFLFACYTGIRFCDIKSLKWSNINFNDENPSIEFTQAKTKQHIILPLNESACEQLPLQRNNDDLIFMLPSANGCNKTLKSWVKKSGIDKVITFHCGRHSFATNLTSITADVFSTSHLLGHASIRHTERYLRVIPENLICATRSLDNNLN